LVVTSLHKSSSNTHLFSPLFLQLLQAIQLRTGRVPNDTISASMPFFSNSLATSLSAKNVFPAFRGLPLINNTFIKLQPITYNLSPFIIVDIFRFVFILYLRLLGRYTHRHYTQRNNMFRQTKHLLNHFSAVHIRM